MASPLSSLLCQPWLSSHTMTGIRAGGGEKKLPAGIYLTASLVLTAALWGSEVDAANKRAVGAKTFQRALTTARWKPHQERERSRAPNE